MQITSLEVWETLEEKMLRTAKRVEKIDLILFKRLVNLVNHFNGNIPKNKQFVCVESIDQIVKNISKESYYRDRKYSQDEMADVMKLSEELSVLLKILMSEQRTYIISEKASANEKSFKEDNRLPNINNDKAKVMFEIKK